MYGLKQAAILAYTKLISILKPFGYHPIPHTVGMWQHKKRKTKFCLCVDDFGIKYTCLHDAQHLLNALTSAYTISTDWTGKHYCGLTLDWDYTGRTVDISTPNYIHKVFHKYQHTPPDKPMYAPHTYNEPVYGKRRQMAPDLDESSYLSPKGIKEIQGIIGSFLYYARAVDPTMLTALNELSGEQSKPTTNTHTKVNLLLDYAHTYPNATLRYRASDMVLCVESDVTTMRLG